MGKFLMAVLQIDSQSNKKLNLEKVDTFIDEAASHGAQFIAMPENIHYCGPKDGVFANAETIPGPMSNFFASKAKQHGIWLHCGSIGEIIQNESKLYNTTLLYNPQGKLAARYEKIHMYDVDIKDGPSTRESDTKKPGERIVVCNTDFCKVGLSICYDMRFPEIYRIMALMGAKLIFVPANYTMFTGKDHWECILKTRAIENQCYIVAPAQIGKKPAFQAYGRSMVINPWGITTACAEDRETIIYAEIDPDYVEQIRNQLPSLKNRHPSAYSWPIE